MEPSRTVYDVALSFAGEDRPYVANVAKRLREDGIQIFYDEYQMTSLWGKDLYAYLSDIYGKLSRFTVMFISNHYARKAWPNHERQNAQARALEIHREYILPVRFDDTTIPGLPSTIAYLDIRGMPPDELARIIKEKVGQSQTLIHPVQMSNKDLKAAARRLIRSVYGLIAEWESAGPEDFNSMVFATEEQEAAAWRRASKALGESERAISQYSKRYMIEAILVRDELLYRLQAPLVPDELLYRLQAPDRDRDHYMNRNYHNPNHPSQLTRVIEDLSALANGLPTSGT